VDILKIVQSHLKERDDSINEELGGSRYFAASYYRAEFHIHHKSVQLSDIENKYKAYLSCHIFAAMNVFPAIYDKCLLLKNCLSMIYDFNHIPATEILEETAKKLDDLIDGLNPTSNQVDMFKSLAAKTQDLYNL